MRSVIERLEALECKTGPGPYGRTYFARLKLIGDAAVYPVELVISETVRVRALSEEAWEAAVQVKLEKLAAVIKGDRPPGVTRAAIDYRELDDLLVEARDQALIAL